MSIIINDTDGADFILLAADSYGATLTHFKKSLKELTMEKNRLSSLNTNAESGCLYELREELSCVNDSLEKEYQAITDILGSMHKHLLRYGLNLQTVDEEAGMMIS